MNFFYILIILTSSLFAQETDGSLLLFECHKNSSNKCQISMEYESANENTSMLQGRIKILNSGKIKRLLEFGLHTRTLNLKGKNEYIYNLVSQLDDNDEVVVEVKINKKYVEVLKVATFINNIKSSVGLSIKTSP